MIHVGKCVNDINKSWTLAILLIYSQTSRWSLVNTCFV